MSDKYKLEGRPSTIFRTVKSKDNPYVMLDRRPVDNPALSFKAKGILTYLMSRPDGWEVSVTDLVKHSLDKEASVRSGLKELRKAGHMKYNQSRKGGRITGWLIEVYEVPFPPDSDFQQVVIQQVENRGQVISTLSTNDLKIKSVSEKPLTPATPGKREKRETPKSGDQLDGMLKYARDGLDPATAIMAAIGEYPAELQDLLRWVCAAQGWAAPAIPAQMKCGKKNPDFSWWVQELYELKRQMNGQGEPAIRAAAKQSSGLTISHPGALRETLISVVGKMHKTAASHQDQDQARTPFEIAMSQTKS